MTNPKKITVYHTSTSGFICVEMDLAFREQIKELVEFWAGYKARLKCNAGNYVNTFLKHLCEEVLSVQREGNYNLAGVIANFGNREGWCKLDGSEGLKLVSVSPMNLVNQDHYFIVEK